MTCPECGWENPAGVRFCVSCGRALSSSCANCGASIEPDFLFCGACGHPVAGPTDAKESRPEALSEQRRRVTILFADLVGFSSLAEHMDPEELRDMITDTFAEATALVRGREGTVEKFIGDAIMVVFGIPRAHEDDPVRAVHTALELMVAVKRRSALTGLPLQLRIGINSGLVVWGAVGDRRQAGVLGDPVNVAARLQQVAGPGEILVSSAVWRRIRHRFEAERIGPVEVKGREQQVDVYRVIGPLGAPDESPSGSPFVGRQEELTLLELLWSNSVKGHTHVVSLVGEPGVGKSRLLAELPAREAATDIRVSCASNRAYGPFLEIVEKILGRLPKDLGELRELTAAFPAVGEEVVVPLAALLGLSGAPPAPAMADEHQIRQVFRGVCQFLTAVHQDRPGLIVLDDLHWADRSSLDLLAFLLEGLGGVPLMLVMSYRPGLEPFEPSGPRASHTAMRLEVLSPEETVQLARGYLGAAALPADLERMVATRCEGNPFFLEEVLRWLLDLGSVEVVDGQASLTRMDVDIPDTIEGTILARVDRLDATDREALQHAAVIGRQFSADLLRAVLGGRDVKASVESLSKIELIVSAGRDQWAFRHALIHEVVYDTLLIRQRAELHRKVAEAMEVLAGTEAGVLDQLARHYALAGVQEKARQYALAAGDDAAQRMGFVEARDRYETALRLWGAGGEEGRLGLLMKFGWAALLSGDPTAAKTAMLEAEAGFRALGDEHRAGTALATLGRIHFFTGETARARETLDRAIGLLEPEGPSEDLVRAYVWVSILHTVTGQFEDCREVAGRGLGLAEQLGLDAPRSHLLTSLGVAEALSGDAVGIYRIRGALELAERTGEAEAIGRAYLNLAVCQAELSRGRDGIPRSEQGRKTMRRLGAPSFEWIIASREAHMLLDVGRLREAEDLCKEILEAGPVLVPPAAVFAGLALVQVHIRTGRNEEARADLDEVLPAARRIGGSMFLAPALVAEAELEEARGNRAAARAAIEEALELVESAPPSVYSYVPLVPAARLLPDGELGPKLERLREPATRDVSLMAKLKETEGILLREPRLLASAADLYASLELPYQEARARLGAGDLDRATAITERLGVKAGPLVTASQPAAFRGVPTAGGP